MLQEQNLQLQKRMDQQQQHETLQQQMTQHQHQTTQQKRLDLLVQGTQVQATTGNSATYCSSPFHRAASDPEPLQPADADLELSSSGSRKLPKRRGGGCIVLSREQNSSPYSIQHLVLQTGANGNKEALTLGVRARLIVQDTCNPVFNQRAQ
ncbi:hypothetical protein BG011_004418 [Mortierella polycephala]|uniref:Uncharacterized protein n=1 Tax=Mortierella polycephala TaxID=41804 RepID=A0A9P6PYD5_9FUNG|nr:hypothetical protein BG011_004418 [Mortierella polycephala]